MQLNVFTLTLIGLCRDLNAKLGSMDLSRFITDANLSDYSDKGPRCTFNWASPEQLLCKPVTCASDIFSFGVRPVPPSHDLPACLQTPPPITLAAAGKLASSSQGRQSTCVQPSIVLHAACP